MRIAIIAALLLTLQACALLPESVRSAEAAASSAMVHSAERVICDLMPVGTWRREYGANPDKARAWSVMCSETASAPSLPR